MGKLIESVAESERLSIGELSEKTGVNTVTIRAWERRYGLLKPMRSEGGHRLYAPGDVERIKQVQAWLQRGVSVGKVKPLLDAEATRPLSEPHDDSQWQSACEKLLAAACELKGRYCQQQIMQLVRDYSWAQAAQGVLEPLMLQLEEDNSLAGLAFLEAELQHCLSWQLHRQDRKKRQQQVLLILGEKTHAWPLLLQAGVLLDHGFRVDMVLLPRSFEASCQLIESAEQEKIILYQDGQFQAQQLSVLDDLSEQKTSLYLAGAGGMLAELNFKRAGSDLAQLIKPWLKT